MSLLPRLAAFCLASTIATSTIAETFNCVGAHGRTAYLDQPCPADQQDQPGPINVLAACGALVTRCVSPGERDLDACFMSAPRCHSLRPWEDKPFTHCCPEACWLAYKTNRQANMPPLKALDRAMYGGTEGGCLALQR